MRQITDVVAAVAGLSRENAGLWTGALHIGVVALVAIDGAGAEGGSQAVGVDATGIVRDTAGLVAGAIAVRGATVLGCPAEAAGTGV